MDAKRVSEKKQEKAELLGIKEENRMLQSQLGE